MRIIKFKEKIKQFHNKRLKHGKMFKEGDKVLLYNSRFKFSPEKAKILMV